MKLGVSWEHSQMSVKICLLMQGSDLARILPWRVDRGAEAQAGAFTIHKPWNCLAEGRMCPQPLASPSCPPCVTHCPHPVLLPPPGLVLDQVSASISSKKCSCNHFIAYTKIVLHCRIKRFFHIQCRSQPQSLLYLLTHFIKFTSFLLCLCTFVPSAVCTKSYWHFNIKLLWQEDIPLAK